MTGGCDFIKRSSVNYPPFSAQCRCDDLYARCLHAEPTSHIFTGEKSCATSLDDRPNDAGTRIRPVAGGLRMGIGARLME